MSDFGLSDSGFTAMRQTDVIDSINTRLKSTFGSLVNLSTKSVLGNLTGIFSEPTALVWEAIEAVYNSQFASGATGNAVDNILAFYNTSRQAAQATSTAPNGVLASDGTLDNGLVMYGTPGTVIPQGTTFQTATTPPLNFTLDADATIQAATNASQQITFSLAPTSGSMTLTVPTADGQQLVTAPITAPFTVAAIQNALAALTNAAGVKPYTDVSAQLDAGNIILNFGGGASGSQTTTTINSFGANPSSGGQPQPVVQVNSSLLAGTFPNAISVSAMVTVITYGARAQATGSATCTVTGANAVPADTLTVIATPVTGLASVNNDVDCITGAAVESDADALLRAKSSVAGGGSAKLQSVKNAVKAVSGVSNVLGFENLSNAALQNMTLPSPPPTQGSYRLRLAGGTTAAISVTASAKAIQNAINALPGYNVVVTGSAGYGFQVDFNGSLGGAAQPLILVLSAGDGSNVDISVSFGRPPNSFEIVAFGGDDLAIEKAIFSAQPAGIGSYGSPSAVINGSISAGSNALGVDSVAGIVAGLYVTGPSISNGTTVQSLFGNVVTLSQPAPIDGAGNYTFKHANTILDEDGVGHVVSFTRATVVLPYVAVRLLTDYYNAPGDQTSGVNQNATFDPSSVLQVQNELIAIGNSVKAGGTIVSKGYNGLVGAFNNVPGVLDYSMTLEIGQRPDIPAIDDPMPDNVQLLPGNVAEFELLNTDVVWT